MSDLTIAQISEAKKRMEHAIAVQMNEAIATFHQATGFSPKEIEVSLARVDQIGSTPRYLVDHVTARIGIVL